MGIIKDVLDTLGMDIVTEEDKSSDNAEDITNDASKDTEDLFDNPGTNPDDNDEKDNKDSGDDIIEDDSYFNKSNDLDSSDSNDDDNADIVDDDESRNKKMLHKRFANLYDSLDSNIELISNYTPLTSDNAVVSTLNNIKSNLLDCKTVLVNIVENHFDKDSYIVLMRKFISLTKVYDLCTKMLDILFPDKKEDGPSNK